MQPIAKNKIPKQYFKKYDITNAFWIKLINGWRMIYSISSEKNSAEIICIILDCFDHKDYSRKFGYKN